MNDRESESQNLYIYTGPGSSNSWVWLADFLEQFGFVYARFCYEKKELEELSDSDILIIPGGDTFQIAEYFGSSTMRIITQKIASGLAYVGICAGAYLPLRSSIYPLSEFNLVDMKIANIASGVPDGLIDPKRYSLPYGCSIVFHPFRGPVMLRGEMDLIAPIYGGPIMLPVNGERCILSFQGVTENTEILVNPNLCRDILKGSAACIEAKYGKGKLILISPHLEHPNFREANILLSNILRSHSEGYRAMANQMFSGADLQDLRRTISDLRISANALESRSWKVGIKYWESEKLLFFIEAVRKRIERIRRDNLEDRIPISDETLSEFRTALISLKRLANDTNSSKEIDCVVQQLSEGASSFLNAYFALLREDHC